MAEVATPVAENSKLPLPQYTSCVKLLEALVMFTVTFLVPSSGTVAGVTVNELARGIVVNVMDWVPMLAVPNGNAVSVAVPVTVTVLVPSELCGTVIEPEAIGWVAHAAWPRKSQLPVPFHLPLKTVVPLMVIFAVASP